MANAGITMLNKFTRMVENLKVFQFHSFGFGAFEVPERPPTIRANHSNHPNHLNLVRALCRDTGVLTLCTQCAIQKRLFTCLQFVCEQSELELLRRNLFVRIS